MIKLTINILTSLTTTSGSPVFYLKICDKKDFFFFRCLFFLVFFAPVFFLDAAANGDIDDIDDIDEDFLIDFTSFSRLGTAFLRSSNLDLDLANNRFLSPIETNGKFGLLDLEYNTK